LISSNQNLVTNSLSSCCCSLPIPVDILKHPDASFSHSKPLGQLQNCHGPPLGLRFRFLSFFKGTLPPYLNQIICEILMTVVHQIEVIFGIKHEFVCLAQHTAFGDKRHKTWRRRSGGGGFTVCNSVALGALRYKPEDRGFNSRWCHLNFSLI
jgi:hypothetical protein